MKKTVARVVANKKHRERERKKPSVVIFRPSFHAGRFLRLPFAQSDGSRSKQEKKLDYGARRWTVTRIVQKGFGSSGRNPSAARCRGAAETSSPRERRHGAGGRRSNSLVRGRSSRRRQQVAPQPRRREAETRPRPPGRDRLSSSPSSISTVEAFRFIRTRKWNGERRHAAVISCVTCRHQKVRGRRLAHKKEMFYWLRATGSPSRGQVR